mmetsp:Transcript_9696/g.23682  ORF Transcript_9696/g.23682 Transcript_9696/m.23682 type:complete len:220 (+) Transcript_9696:963-1622(+)
MATKKKAPALFCASENDSSPSCQKTAPSTKPRKQFCIMSANVFIGLRIEFNTILCVRIPASLAKDATPSASQFLACMRPELRAHGSVWLFCLSRLCLMLAAMVCAMGLAAKSDGKVSMVLDETENRPLTACSSFSLLMIASAVPFSVSSVLSVTASGATLEKASFGVLVRGVLVVWVLLLLLDRLSVRRSSRKSAGLKCAGQGYPSCSNHSSALTAGPW